MRHQIKKKKLNRPKDHRQALINNLMTSLFLHGRIKTTIAKGKVAAQAAETLLNSVRNDESFNAIRKIGKNIKSEIASRRIMKEWLPKYKDTPSGFVRVIHLGPRFSDAADMVQIELVNQE